MGQQKLDNWLLGIRTTPILVPSDGTHQSGECAEPGIKTKDIEKNVEDSICDANLQTQSVQDAVQLAEAQKQLAADNEEIDRIQFEALQVDEGNGEQVDYFT